MKAKRQDKGHDTLGLKRWSREVRELGMKSKTKNQKSKFRSTTHWAENIK